MNNQIFQPNRFVGYLKWSLFERKNSLLNVLAVYGLLSLVICLLIPYYSGFYTTGAVNPYTELPYTSDPMWWKELKFFLFLWLSSGLMCSDIFSPLQKKTDRTVILTCPASNLEKFTSLFLIYAVAIPIAMTCLYFFADAVRVWVYSAINPECNYIHYIAPDYLLSFGCSFKYVDGLNSDMIDDETLLAMLRHGAMTKYSLILLGGLMVQALYSLGSSVWPKKSAFKTSAFLLGMGIACGNLLYYGFITFFPHDINNIDTRSFGLSDEAQIAVLDICMIAFIIFLWWVTYRRFKEWEVVKRW